MFNFRLKHGHGKYVVVSSLAVYVEFVWLATRPMRARPWTGEADANAFVNYAKWPTKSNAQDPVKLVSGVPQTPAFVQHVWIHTERLFFRLPMQAYVDTQAERGASQMP